MPSIDFPSLREQVRISEVLSRYVEVPTGKVRFRIPCFFHQGVNPNLYVDDAEGYTYCHVCHRSSDVIGVLAYFENLSQGEAASRLQEDYHVESKAYLKGLRDTRRQVEEWKLHKTLPPEIEALPASQRLEPGYRGLSEETINHFGLSYIPEKDGVLMPLRADTGSLLGYSIRQNQKPKYLNSRHLPGKLLLYGLYENKQEIAERGYALVVEGQFDALAIWQRGHRNIVALMGSRMAAEQAQILMRYTPKLVLMLDGDEAGRSGAAEIEERYSPVFSIYRIDLPDGIDPADSQPQHYEGVLRNVMDA